MKSFLRTGGIVGLVFGATLIAHAELRLVGVVVDGEVTQLNFSDTEKGTASGWVTLGGSVEDYTIAEFNMETMVVTLTRGNERKSLPLTPGKVQPKASEPAPVPTSRGLLKIHGLGGRETTLLADLKFDQENRFDLGGGKVAVITPSRMEDGNFVYTVAFKTTANGSIKTYSVPRVVTKPNQAFGLSVAGDKVEFSPLK